MPSHGNRGGSRRRSPLDVDEDFAPNDETASAADEPPSHIVGVLRSSDHSTHSSVHSHPSTSKGDAPATATLGTEAEEFFSMEQLSPRRLLGSITGFERSPVTQTYLDDQVEDAFIAHRALHGVHRFIWCSLFQAIGGAAFGAQRYIIGAPFDIGIRLFVVGIVVLICDVVLLRLRTSHVCGSSLTVAQVREALCFLGLLYLSCDLGYFATSLVQDPQCTWVRSFEPRKENERCPWRLYGIWFGVAQLPVMVGRPRLKLAAIVQIAALLSTLIVSTERVAMRTIVGWGVVASLYTIFCVILKIFDESQQRTHFELQQLLAQQTEAIRVTDESLREFVLAITPPHLRLRLTSAPVDGVIMDMSSRAVVVIVDVEDAAKFVTSQLPSQSAVALAVLGNFALSRGAASKLTHIRSIGPTSYLCSGLFDDYASVPAAVDFALTMCALRPAGFDLMCRCAVAQGQLIGTPTGIACVRYDIFGLALQKAQTLVLECPAHRVRVPPELVEEARLAEYFVVSTQQGEAGVVESRRADVPQAVFDALVPHDAAAGSAVPQSSSAAGCVAVEQIPAQIEPVSSTSAIASAKADDSPRISAEETKRVCSVFVVNDRRKKIAMRNDRDAAGNVDLTMEPMLCCLWRFADAATAVAQEEHHLRYDHAVFAAGCAFYVPLIVSLLAMGNEERWASMDTAMALADTLLIVTMLGFAVLARSVLNHESVHNGVRFLAAETFLCALFLVALTLTRPSIIGDDIGFALTISVTTLSLSCGTLAQIAAAQGTLFALFFVLMFAFRPLVTPGTMIYTPIVVFAIALTVIYRDETLKHVFRDLCANRAALRAVRASQLLREAVLEGLVPRQLLHKIGPMSCASNRMDGWSVDDAVVMSMRFHNYSGDSEAFARWTQHPEDCKVLTESTIGRFERAVLGCPHRSLDIIKIFGGQIIIAGPLQEGGQSVADAVTDAMHIVNEVLADATLQLPFTIAISCDQVINMLRLSEAPSHDVFGAAPRTSWALMDAAPTPMVVATERFAQVYRRECSPLTGLEVCAPESWRVRGAGSVRVCRVRRRRRIGAETSMGSKDVGSFASSSASASVALGVD